MSLMEKMNASFDQFMEQLNKEELERAEMEFNVTDLESAAEAQRRIAYFNDQMADIDKIIQSQIQPFLDKVAKIEAWGEESKKEYVDKIHNYETLLENYMREEIKKQVEAGKKPKKTMKLPYGKISLKAQQAKYQRDEDKLRSYAKDKGFTEALPEKVKWSELKKWLNDNDCQIANGYIVDNDGEIVPGVTVEEQDDKFEVKLD